MRKVGSEKARNTFFAVHPQLRGRVRVHHAVEQQVLHRFPGIFGEDQMHLMGNLRGIPTDLNNDLHLRQIRAEWDDFYGNNPNPTRQQLLDKAAEIDAKYGHKFVPPVGPDEQ